MRLIDADALKKDWNMGNKCEDCPRYARDCQYGMVLTWMDVCEMLDDAPTVEMPGWVSVKDRLPDKQPCEYLVVNGNNVETALCLDNRWITPRRVTKITHWMPLPEPPKEVKQDADGA